MKLNSQNIPTGAFDLKKIIKTYTRHWFWFLLALVLSISIAYVDIRYSTPQYAAEASIRILDGEGTSSELGAFQDLEVLPGGRNVVEDEIQIIRSRSNMIEVVKSLRLNVSIFAKGAILDSEIYGDPPIKINFIEHDSIIHNSFYEFFITISSATTFGYSRTEDEAVKVYSFGKNVPTPIGDMIITPNIVDFGSFRGRKFRVVVNPVVSVATNYLDRLGVYNSSKSSNIVYIYLQDGIQRKARDIINSLIEIYNKNAVEDKKAVADATSEFIDNRISIIYSNLSSVDQNAQEFKSQRGLTDIANEASLNLSVGAASKQELQNATVQLNMASYMQDVVDSQEGYETLPSNIGLSDPSIASTTAKWNELVAERERLLKSSGEKNPIIQQLDQRLNGLKTNMKSSLGTMSNNLGLQVNSLSKQVSQINSRIYSVPGNERALREITRKQGTQEALYLYLLQKREEAQIAFASAEAKSKVINSAYGLGWGPVSPVKRNIYFMAVALGLLIPFLIIYVRDLLDNKVHNKTGLEKLVNDVPVLAELPKLSKRDEKLIQKDDRSVLSESLRILRTNLDYLIKSKRGARNNVVYVTSSVPGEGKTFLASNLSMIFSNTNKKVLLIGADIRNPKLYTFFTNENVDKLGKSKRNKDEGLTEYLYDNSLEVKDITQSMLVHTNTIDVIYSGKIPPNPAELLMSDRMKDLIEEASLKYDYVIVDTAPLMVVTDTLLISQYADHIIYVTRAGVTENRVLEFPLRLKEEGKLKGLSFVVNSVKEAELGYGGKYGYGYGQTTKKWWKLF